MIINLSPYEKNRIVPEAFGQTEMGRDLLAQDYLLKQITASVIYPEGDIGKQFWGRVYAEAFQRYGTTDIPVDTFNKVWIVPAKAVVYESKEAAYVVESHLKVMLETDYLATQVSTPTPNDPNDIAREVLREIVIPILEKEVNEGMTFAPLRQIYYSLILATWYKRKVKDSIMGQAYVDRNKTAGIDIADKNQKEWIWQQYVEAFRKGAYNYIKEDYNLVTQEVVPREYFAGGADMGQVARTYAPTFDAAALPSASDRMLSVQMETQLLDLSPKPSDNASTSGRKQLLVWAKEHQGQTVDVTLEELATQYNYTRQRVHQIASKYGIKTKGNVSREGVQLLRAWAEKHRGEIVDITLVELGLQFAINSYTVSGILKKYDIKTSGQRRKRDPTKGAERLREFAKKHRDETLDMFSREIDQEYGLSPGRIKQILGENNVRTKGQVQTEGAKRLRAFAEKHRNETLDMVLSELAQEYNLSIRRVHEILREYNIKTKGKLQTEGAKLLRAFAEKHRDETLDMFAREIGQEYVLSGNRVIQILGEYNIKTKGMVQPEGEELMRGWAKQNQGQTVNVTAVELGRIYSLKPWRVYQILREFNIKIAVMRAGRKDSSMSDNAGGINLDPAQLDLKTKNNDGEIKFDLDPAMLQRVQNVSGVTPVILNILPLGSLQKFLDIR
ncbi:MAG: hypothetical protein HQL20_04515 [Candidatus Omnitrophica bacterium]|nr:hypothetical protein [Candidatus Omnitrophota bacterium]